MPKTIKKTKLGSLMSELRDREWEPTLTEESYKNIIDVGFRRKNLSLAAVAIEIAIQEQPLTLRGLFYLVVSAGWLPSTDRKHYLRLGRILTMVREAGIIPFEWIVDNVRQTDKPSSWTGILDFVQTVRDAFRLDFWARMPSYVHIFCEKDARAGTIMPVTREYDVSLSIIRGYSSLSFAHGIAQMWSQIEKPIYAYYLGDLDPSGIDLERDLREKLSRYATVDFSWRRLAINADDFERFDLLTLDPKKTDKRYQKFVEQHGYKCAELDALPASELRRRVEEAIKSHIQWDEWLRLQDVERTKRESFNRFLESVA